MKRIHCNNIENFKSLFMNSNIIKGNTLLSTMEQTQRQGGVQNVIPHLPTLWYYSLNFFYHSFKLITNIIRFNYVSNIFKKKSRVVKLFLKICPAIQLKFNKIGAMVSTVKYKFIGQVYMILKQQTSPESLNLASSVLVPNVWNQLIEDTDDLMSPGTVNAFGDLLKVLLFPYDRHIEQLKCLRPSS